MHAIRPDRRVSALTRIALFLLITALILTALQFVIPATAVAAESEADQTPPVTTATLPSGWRNSDVTITLSATDEMSGVAATYWRLNALPAQQGTSLVVSAEGVHTLSFWSVDWAGNVESPKTALVQIDKMAPLVMGQASTIQWTNQPVTVTFTCTDTLSGVKLCPDPITVSVEGFNLSVTGASVDNAGNGTEAMVTGIKIDMTAPTINGSADRAPNSFGWYNAAVTLSFDCVDNLSGLNACEDPIILSTEGADQSVSGNAKDRAGNTASTTVSGLNIDWTAPTITAMADRMANAAGWYGAPVTVSFACADALSGVATCASEQTLSGEGAGQFVTGAVSDLAGNTASASTSEIKIDLTAPTVSYAGNAGTYTLDQQVYITCSASDSLSGIGSTTCQTISGPASSFALGINTFSATATDNAGNSSSTSTSFEVVASFDGLCDLVKQFVSKNGIEKALCGKLEAGHVGPFINQVQAQSGKAMTVEQAQILIQLAQQL